VDATQPKPQTLSHTFLIGYSHWRAMELHTNQANPVQTLETHRSNPAKSTPTKSTPDTRQSNKITEQKKVLAAEKQLSAEIKKLHQSKKQFTIPTLKRQKKVSFTSVQSIGFHVLTSTSRILLLKGLSLTDNCLVKIRL
jgi:hypothetical protein